MPARINGAFQFVNIGIGAIGTGFSFGMESITMGDLNTIGGAAAGFGTAIYMGLCIFDWVAKKFGKAEKQGGKK